MLSRIYQLVALLLFADVVMKASCTKKRSLTFVICDNKSMKDDIKTIKDNVHTVFSGTIVSIYNVVLVTFNRTDVHVKANTLTEFYNALEATYTQSINPDHDCQESSMKALITALHNSNRSSHIFLFTNASPKNYQNDVQELCQIKQSQISFISIKKKVTLTDKYSNKNKDVYGKIAQACSGLAFELNDNVLTPDIFHYIRHIISANIIIAATTFPAGVSSTIAFDEDDQMDHVIVAASGKKVNFIVNGHIGKIRTIMSNNNAIVTVLCNPMYGRYSSSVTVKHPSETSVLIVGRSDFFFNHGFSELKPKTLNDTSPQPLIDVDVHFLSVLVTDERQAVEITTAKILGMDDRQLKPDLPLTKISKDFYITQPLVTPTEMFKVAVNGIVKATGHNIKRFTKIPITPAKAIDKPDNQRPKVVIAEGNETSIEYNSSLTLTCKVTAYPEPKITWYNKKGNQLPSKNSKINHPADYISYLDIATSVNDSYLCRAVNDAGTEGARIKVNVMPPFTINNTLYSVNVEYGKSKVLKCDIKSKLPMKLIWYHLDEDSGMKLEIYDSDDYSVSADKTELTIKKMNPDLTGKYICFAFLVDDKEIKTELKVLVKITGLTAPEVNLPKYVKTVKGTTAVLECHVSGVPTPTIEWEFGGKSGSTFESMGETESVLRINNVEAKHEGQYKCVAENSVATNEKVTTLIIQGIPRILSRRSIIYQAFEGDAALKIPCVAVGEPKPSITWKMDGRPIPEPSKKNSKYVVEDGALIIKYPKEADTKSYSCVATNAAGSETATFKTFIRQNPQSPGVTPKKTNRKMSVGKTCSAKPRVKTTWFANRPNGVYGKNKKGTLLSLQECEKK